MFINKENAKNFMVEEVKKSRDVKAVKTKTDQQIKYLYGKVTLTPEEVYTVTKNFFSQLLEIDYEFSHEELLEELSKTYIDIELKEYIKKFIQSIGKIEYNSQIKFSPEELKVFLEQLQQIVDKLVIEEAKQNSRGFSLFATKETKNLGELIEEIKLETRLDQAKEKYQEALETYNNMDESDQQFYYDRLQEAFKHLKAFAEKYTN